MKKSKFTGAGQEHVTLFTLTKHGPAAFVGDERYQSDMPAYESVLSDKEILATLSYIRSRQPEVIRQRYDGISNGD